MLKTHDPLLTPELLFVLAAMGHGDELVLCDANFPADSVGRLTVHRRPVRLAAADVPTAAAAILSVLPLDDFVTTPAARMQPDTEADSLPAVQQEVQDLVDAAAGRHRPMEPIERLAFYDRAKTAFAVVATGERRFWGCFVFRKGVIPPPPFPSP
jgi:L-fucose mutarotase